jgi:hypothetical protein
MWCLTWQGRNGREVRNLLMQNARPGSCAVTRGASRGSCGGITGDQMHSSGDEYAVDWTLRRFGKHIRFSMKQSTTNSLKYRHLQQLKNPRSQNYHIQPIFPLNLISLAHYTPFVFPLGLYPLLNAVSPFQTIILNLQRHRLAQAEGDRRAVHSHPDDGSLAANLVRSG